MTPIREKLDELRKAVEKATVGEWKVLPSDSWCATTLIIRGPHKPPYDSEDHISILNGDEDANFIATARNHIPEVLDYISRLERIVELAGKITCARSNCCMSGHLEVREAVGKLNES